HVLCARGATAARGVRSARRRKGGAHGTPPRGSSTPRRTRGNGPRRSRVAARKALAVLNRQPGSEEASDRRVARATVRPATLSLSGQRGDDRAEPLDFVAGRVVQVTGANRATVGFEVECEHHTERVI